MPLPPRRRSRRDSPIEAAEALFKSVTTRPLPEDRPATLPNAKELVSLRIDRDILDRYQKDGPGWQERINQALRRAIDD